MPTFDLKTAAVAFALTACAGPALADAIDGNWCHNDGRRFSIRGPEIVTPAGTRMDGNYSRHWFSYTVPAQEPGAGQTVFMALANENTIHLRLGDAAADKPQETWVRCLPSLSALEGSTRS